MATVYGANQTLLNSGYQIPAGQLGGEVKLAYDSYTFPANAFTLNDIIQLGIHIPQGAMIVGAFVKAPSLGTVGIFHLGTAADPDSLVIADAGGAAVLAECTSASADFLAVITDADKQQYQLKCTEATDAASGLVIHAGVYYKML